MISPPQNETEYWDRVIEFAATANETTTAEDVRAIMGLSDDVMALIDKEAYERFRKRQPNPNRPAEEMIDTVRAWEIENNATKYAEQLPGGVDTERSRALREAKLNLIGATARDQDGDLIAMERVYRMYRALYKAYIAARKEQSNA
jgi:hypothetical protein